ncbi:DUF4435 domain-containing protein [Halobacillus rhizosphaerae]|uniref:DUF4435 domain-containing protein n=1 Tax=Halobacillus rhizosphaerae TaxID=3064889 RepID=UPI00398AA100
MPLPSINVDELVETLKRSSLPTVFVEGKDDAIIYRYMNEKLSDLDVDFLQCGGRNKLLEIYERRGEFSNLKTAFIADQDLWIFTSDKDQYKDIVFTTGYSIENDLLAGALEKVEALVQKKDMYDHCIQEVCKWYSFEVERFLNGDNFSIDHHIREVLDKKCLNLCGKFLEKKDFSTPSQAILNDLLSDYPLKLRGKTFSSILEIYTNFNKNQLFESIVAFIDDHEYLTRILEDVREAFNSQVAS